MKNYLRKVQPQKERRKPIDESFAPKRLAINFEPPMISTRLHENSYGILGCGYGQTVPPQNANRLSFEEAVSQSARCPLVCQEQTPLIFRRGENIR